MKSPFSRFFWSGEREAETEVDADFETKMRNDQEQIEKIAIDAIRPNKYQPRYSFSEEKIEELARTIHTHGVIQPIVIRSVMMDSMKL